MRTVIGRIGSAVKHGGRAETVERVPHETDSAEPGRCVAEARCSTALPPRQPFRPTERMTNPVVVIVDDVRPSVRSSVSQMCLPLG
jgi:hypothetical protein